MKEILVVGIGTEPKERYDEWVQMFPDCEILTCDMMLKTKPHYRAYEMFGYDGVTRRFDEIHVEWGMLGYIGVKFISRISKLLKRDGIAVFETEVGTPICHLLLPNDESYDSDYKWDILGSYVDFKYIYRPDRKSWYEDQYVMHLKDHLLAQNMMYLYKRTGEQIYENIRGELKEKEFHCCVKIWDL